MQAIWYATLWKGHSTSEVPAAHRLRAAGLEDGEEAVRRCLLDMAWLWQSRMHKAKQFKSPIMEPGIVVHALNPAFGGQRQVDVWEFEARTQWVLGQPELHQESLSQNKTDKR